MLRYMIKNLIVNVLLAILTFDDCMAPGEEFCISYAFNYYGPTGLDVDFYLDGFNSSMGYSLESAVNDQTGTTEILLGSNTFTICFIYNGICDGGDVTHVFFDGVIPGIDCKIWEMFDIPCCPDHECLDLKIESTYLGCAENLPNGYSLELQFEDPNQLGYQFTLTYDSGTVSSVNHTYIGSSLFITATLEPNEEDPSMCVFVDFSNPSICDEELCFFQPDCVCNDIVKLNVVYPSGCRGVGTEFCLPVSFYYYGYNSIPLDFVLDENNSSSDYELTSYTSTGTSPNIENGLNTFVVCFIYSGPCSTGITDLAFDIITKSNCSLSSAGQVGCCFSAQAENTTLKESEGVILGTEKGTLEIMVSPNPFSSTFSLSVSSLEETVGMVAIYDILGKNLFEKEISLIDGNNDFLFNPSLKNQGLYIVKLTTSNGKTITTTIVKTR